MTNAREGGASSVRPPAQVRRILGAGLIAVGMATGVYWAGSQHEEPPAPDQPLGVVEVAPLVNPPQTAAQESPQAAYESPVRVELGERAFVLDIPKLERRWMVKEGVRLVDIKRNPGHFPGTAMPGELGNVSIAAHRLEGMFWDIDRLRVGDSIVVEAGGEKFTYQVYKREIVKPDDVRVVQSDPSGKSKTATRKLLTLVTCLKTGNHRREIVHATLMRQETVR